MPDYNVAYVYNEAIGKFEDKPISLLQLIKMKRNRDSRLALIKKSLYCQKENDDNYKLIFAYPKERKPYLRRMNAEQFRRKGFASVCESNLHKACKCGLAEAKSVKIQIEGKFYIINKRLSYTERICELMDCSFETDCEYEIEGISQDVRTLLRGGMICFEIHHKSAVDAKKGLAYMLSGKPILEFDILEKYIPKRVLNEECSYEECVEYFKNYYEDTENHYIIGTFFKPYEFKLNWNGERANVIGENGDNMEVVVFCKDASYRILYIIEGKKFYDNTYFGEEMRTKETARKFAEYRVAEHIAGRNTIGE